MWHRHDGVVWSTLGPPHLLPPAVTKTVFSVESAYLHDGDAGASKMLMVCWTREVHYNGGRLGRSRSRGGDIKARFGGGGGGRGSGTGRLWESVKTVWYGVLIQVLGVQRIICLKILLHLSICSRLERFWFGYVRLKVRVPRDRKSVV